MSQQTVEEYERRAREAESSAKPTFLKIGRAVVWVLYAIVMVIVIILMTAFVLRLFGASVDAPFTQWVYRSAESAMRPFRGIFPVKELGDASVLDVSLLFGALMYVLLAIGVDAIYHRLSRRLEREETEIATLRANADAVRLQFEAQQQAAFYDAQRAAAQQYAAEQAARQHPLQ